MTETLVIDKTKGRRRPWLLAAAFCVYAAVLSFMPDTYPRDVDDSTTNVVMGSLSALAVPVLIVVGFRRSKKRRLTLDSDLPA